MYCHSIPFNPKMPGRIAAPLMSCLTRKFATSIGQSSNRQTYIEKIVQKYAVGLPSGKLVKAGDYVMIKPQYVMTHDNTGPVISK